MRAQAHRIDAKARFDLINTFGKERCNSRRVAHRAGKADLDVGGFPIHAAQFQAQSARPHMMQRELFAKAVQQA